MLRNSLKVFAALVVATAIGLWIAPPIPYLTYPFLGFVSETGNSLATGASAHPVLKKLTDSRRLLVWPTAHRGDESVGPDNSLSALKVLIEFGLPLIEIDVRWTDSGYLFLFHDSRVSNLNSGGPEDLLGRATRGMKEPELRRLKLANGESVPSFREALELIKGSASVYQLDMKSKSRYFLDAMLREIYQAKAREHVIIQAYSTRVLKYLRTYHPTIAVLARTRSLSGIEAVLPYSPEIIQVDAEWMTDAVVAKVREGKSRLLVKMLGEDKDSPEQWREVLDRGADIVLTDSPLRFWKEFRDSNLRRLRKQARSSLGFDRKEYRRYLETAGNSVRAIGHQPLRAHNQ